MMLAIATILLSALKVTPADVSGRWEGNLTATRNDGTTHEDTVLLILAQKDGKITGSARAPRPFQATRPRRAPARLAGRARPTGN